MTTPSYLTIGHLCHDLHEGKYLLGGTASYAALVAQKLGKQPAILTSVGDDFEFFDWLSAKGIVIQNQKAKHTTVFQNIYENESRTQYIRNRAATIEPQELPALWNKIPIVHLGLIANELNFDLLDAFDESLIGASIQGCLRQWDETGKVTTRKMDWSLLKKTDLVFISEDDIEGIENALADILKHVSHLVLTKGKHGAIVYHNEAEHFFPAYPTEEVDPTGAGDVFATAYLIKFAETNSIQSAAVFAHCAASCVVESIGLTSLNSMDEIEKRVANYASINS